MMSLLASGTPGLRAAETTGVLDGVTPRFELQGQDGRTVTERDFRGGYLLLAFGFTQCRHVCPTMVANMGLALKQAPASARGVFVSVDTERDSPAIAQRYAQQFHPAIAGLGGSFEAVQAAARNFGISYVVTKSEKAYTVEHSSDIFVLDADGNLIEVFAMNADPADIAAVMRPTDTDGN